jgi:hypothetical protein
MTFVELAKLVGTRWGMQSLNDRDTWTSRALEAKLRFEDQLRLYKETTEYSQHQQYLQGFKNRHNPSSPVEHISEGRNKVASHIDTHSEPTKTVASLEFLLTQRQEVQEIACATDDNTRSKERTPPKLHQCVGMNHSLPAPFLRTDYGNPNLEELIDGHEVEETEDSASSFPCVTTRPLEESQYFRTVLLYEVVSSRADLPLTYSRVDTELQIPVSWPTRENSATSCLPPPRSEAQT